MASTTPIQFRADEALTACLRARDPQGAQNPGTTARRGLTLWYSALDKALEAYTLEAAEILLLCQVVEQWEVAGADPSDLVDELPQAILDNDAPHFDHVREALADKAMNWPTLERWAAVDYTERYMISRRLYGGTLPEIVARIEGTGRRG